jgi:hypothetical protein
MNLPDLQGFLESSLIIRGRSYSEGRAYVLKTLSRLLARSELSSLYRSAKPIDERRPVALPSSNRNKPVATKVVKTVTRSSIACFEVLWTIPATTTDSEGNPIDEFEFTTIEEQSVVKKCYPDLVDKFKSIEKELLKQGSAEQERRRAFLESMTKNDSRISSECLPKANYKASKNGREFFARKDSSRAFNRVSSLANDKDGTTGLHYKSMGATHSNLGDDVVRILQQVTGKQSTTRTDGIGDIESIDTVSTISSDNVQLNESMRLFDGMRASPGATKENSPYKFTLSPGHLHFLRTPILSPNTEHALGPLELELHYERVEGRDDYVGAQERGVFRQEPSGGDRRSPQLLDRSPSIKRSRVTSTPPVTARVHQFEARSGMEVKGSFAVDVKSYHESYYESELLPEYELCCGIPTQEWGCQSEDFAVDENVLNDTLLNHECIRASLSAPPGVYQREHEEDQESLPLKPQGEDAFDTGGSGRLLLANLDESLLADSFAGVSIHSIRSPNKNTRAHVSPSDRWRRPDESMLQITPPVNSKVHWLTPAFFPEPDHSEIPELPPEEHPRRNLEVDGYDIVQTAIAKWEHKSRLAKMDDANCQFVQEALRYDSF